MRWELWLAVLAVILVCSLVPWMNRTTLPVIWAGTAIIGDQGHPAEMPGVEIGFRGDGIVIWRRKGKN